MIIINKFIELRKQKGFSQTKLGELVGGSQQLIQQIEAGVVRTTKKIYKLASVLEVPAHELDPDIPKHMLADLFEQMIDWDPADTDWVVGRFRKDWEHVQSRRLGRTTPQASTPPVPSRTRRAGTRRR